MIKYPVDSPWAAARLLALGISVDGKPVQAELEVLERYGIFRNLELNREDFKNALNALCTDLRASCKKDEYGFVHLQRAQVNFMLDEIRDPELRRELAGRLLDTMGTDSEITRAESHLFWDALDYWGLPLREVRRPAGQALNA